MPDLALVPRPPLRTQSARPPEPSPSKRLRWPPPPTPPPSAQSWFDKAQRWFGDHGADGTIGAPEPPMGPFGGSAALGGGSGGHYGGLSALTPRRASRAATPYSPAAHWSMVQRPETAPHLTFTADIRMRAGTWEPPSLHAELAPAGWDVQPAPPGALPPRLAQSARKARPTPMNWTP